MIRLCLWEGYRRESWATFRSRAEACNRPHESSWYWREIIAIYGGADWSHKIQDSYPAPLVDKSHHHRCQQSQLLVLICSMIGLDRYFFKKGWSRNGMRKTKNCESSAQASRNPPTGSPKIPYQASYHLVHDKGMSLLANRFDSTKS